MTWISGYDFWGTRAENRPAHRPIPAPGLPVLKPDLGPAVVYRPATRPPLAGPYAFSRIPTPVWNKPRVFLMHDIASPWLFTNLTIGYEIACLKIRISLFLNIKHFTSNHQSGLPSNISWELFVTCVWFLVLGLAMKIYALRCNWLI